MKLISRKRTYARAIIAEKKRMIPQNPNTSEYAFNSDIHNLCKEWIETPEINPMQLA